MDALGIEKILETIPTEEVIEPLGQSSPFLRARCQSVQAQRASVVECALP